MSPDFSLQHRAPAPARRHDWIGCGVIAIVLLVYFHTGMIFAAEWGWHIKNPETSALVLELNFFMSRWRMALLFLISGSGRASRCVAARRVSTWRSARDGCSFPSSSGCW